MKILKEFTETTKKPVKIYCNKCGNEIIVNENGYFEDHLEINKKWGYFSMKDGEQHNFDLCQKCYDNFIKGFKIPVDISDNN